MYYGWNVACRKKEAAFDVQEEIISLPDAFNCLFLHPWDDAEDEEYDILFDGTIKICKN